MKPTIKRSKYSRFYHADGFSLLVTLGRNNLANNILTFTIANDEVSSVLVDRKESAHVLKKFKKVLDKSRKS